jgi:hypothetical protein
MGDSHKCIKTFELQQQKNLEETLEAFEELAPTRQTLQPRIKDASVTANNIH